MSRRGTAEQWIARINDYRASGDSVVDWCERNHVRPKQLYYWMAKFKKTDPQAPPAGGPTWVALPVADATTVETSPLVVRIGTVAVEVRPGFEPAVLADVVRTLKALC